MIYDRSVLVNKVTPDLRHIDLICTIMYKDSLIRGSILECGGQILCVGFTDLRPKYNMHHQLRNTMNMLFGLVHGNV